MQNNRQNQVQHPQLGYPVSLAQQQYEARRKERALAQPAPKASFVEAVKRFFLKYARFNGCASRREYWFAQLFIFLAVAALSALIGGGEYLEETNSELGPVVKGVGEMLIYPFLVACFIPSLSILVRRLHDANFSGWFLLLLFTPAAIVLPILAMMPSRPEAVARFPGRTKDERAQKRQEAFNGVAAVVGVGAAVGINYLANRDQGRSSSPSVSGASGRTVRQPTPPKPAPRQERFFKEEPVYEDERPRETGKIGRFSYPHRVETTENVPDGLFSIPQGSKGTVLSDQWCGYYEVAFDGRSGTIGVSDDCLRPI